MTPLQSATPQWQEGEEKATCPVCHSAGPKRRIAAANSPFEARPPLDYLGCASCGVCFVPDFKVPPYDAAAPVMTQFYLEQGAGIDTMVEPLFALPHIYINKYIEVGCGYGFAVDFAARELGFDARGFDPSSNAAEGRRALELNIDPAPWSYEPAASVDLLYGSEMIEHLPDPNSFLSLASRQLESGGTLLLTTPNASWLGPASPSFANFAILSAGYHCVLFTPPALERALRAAGFTHLRTWQRGFTLAISHSRGLPSLRRLHSGLEATEIRSLWEHFTLRARRAQGRGRRSG